MNIGSQMLRKNKVKIYKKILERNNNDPIRDENCSVPNSKLIQDILVFKITLE
jgi:hypothetical protein